MRLTSGSETVGRSALARVWADFILEKSRENALDEGWEYAKRGQVLSLSVSDEPGVLAARVQGRAARPYTVRLAVEAVTAEQWDRIIKDIADRPRLVAGVVQRELTNDVLDQIEEIGLVLRPVGMRGEVRAECSCGRCRQGERGWCKHVVAAGLIFADKLDSEPLLTCSLRGMEPDEIIERIRMLRSIEIGGGQTEAVRAIEWPESRQVVAQPFESVVGEFWSLDSRLDELETSPGQPEVAHALLRRLGPSPFTESRFPMVGLMATCYDLVTEDVLRRFLVGGE